MTQPIDDRDEVFAHRGRQLTELHDKNARLQTSLESLQAKYKDLKKDYDALEHASAVVEKRNERLTQRHNEQRSVILTALFGAFVAIVLIAAIAGGALYAMNKDRQVATACINAGHLWVNGNCIGAK